MRDVARFITTLVLAMPAWVDAAEGTRPNYPPPSTVNSGSIVQILFSLLLVLAVIILIAWLLKRVNIAQHNPNTPLKILGSMAIGQRERVVLLEVKDTWLVVGVGPGQIRTLHTLHKQDAATQENQWPQPMPSGSKFSNMLSNLLHYQPAKK